MYGTAWPDPLRFCHNTDEDLEERLRHEAIAENAYYRAKARGFIPGYELDDWLTAEAEVDAINGKDLHVGEYED